MQRSPKKEAHEIGPTRSEASGVKPASFCRELQTGQVEESLIICLECPISRAINNAMVFVQTARGKAVGFLFVLLLHCGIGGAQTFQFLPEVNVYSKITPKIRFVFQTKETREAGDPTQAEIGPSLDFFVKPLVRLRNIAVFDLDDAKSRLLQLSVGYRYVPSPDKPTVQRMMLAATPHFPLIGGILFTDRNRADLDWSNEMFTWRYRNRASLQRRISIGSFHSAPYLSAEVFYQSQYQKWSTTALYAGCQFSLRKHLELNPYYEHQNLTGKPPNKQLNQLGLILNLYF